MVPTVGRIGSGSDSEVSEEDRVTALGLLLAAAICPVSHMHYTPDPAASGGLREIPWIETSNGVFRAHLFYYGSTPWAKSKPLGARIFTTLVKRPVNPKVLWIPRHPSGARTMLIRGRRLDASGSFTRREHVVSGGAFPSYVLVPQAGCWRVTVISGKLSGSVVLRRSIASTPPRPTLQSRLRGCCAMAPTGRPPRLTVPRQDLFGKIEALPRP